MGQYRFAKMAADFPGTAVTTEINTADNSVYYLKSEINDDLDMLQHVVENAKLYFSRPDDFDRAWREELGDDEE